MQSMTIGALDDNIDGKVEKDELRGPMASLKAHFEEMDANHDGGLDEKELAAGNVSRATARQRADNPDL
jgi:hypothetical protein